MVTVKFGSVCRCEPDFNWIRDDLHDRQCPPFNQGNGRMRSIHLNGIRRARKPGDIHMCPYIYCIFKLCRYKINILLILQKKRF